MYYIPMKSYFVAEDCMHSVLLLLSLNITNANIIEFHDFPVDSMTHGHNEREFPVESAHTEYRKRYHCVA